MLARGRFAGHARIAVSGGIESSGVFDASKRSAQDTRDAHHLARRQVGDGDEQEVVAVERVEVRDERLRVRANPVTHVKVLHARVRLFTERVDAAEQLDVACRIAQTLSFKFRLADGCCLSGLPFL